MDGSVHGFCLRQKYLTGFCHGLAYYHGNTLFDDASLFAGYLPQGIAQEFRVV